MGANDFYSKFFKDITMNSKRQKRIVFCILGFSIFSTTYFLGGMHSTLGGGAFSPYRAQSPVYRKLPGDRQYIVRHMQDLGNLFDKIAFYKAPDLDDVELTFGCNQFQKYHKKNYNEKWEEFQDKIDYDEYLFDKKRSKSRINVKKIYQDH